jgi:transcriptional regulator GlxA family with amidase domain
LLAETELLSERSITLHWSYAEKFRAIFPNVVLHPERPLVVSGDHSELITSGAAMSWHDLVLYLISRLVGRTAAQSMANFFALQWHQDGVGPYIVFEGQKDHGDGAISAAQRWLADHYAVADPVAEVVSLSDLAERTFMRRFQQATGHSPLTSVQHLRVEDAKRRLERTIEPIERISWHVGYEEPAIFRRLFKRIAGVTPGQYRRRFRVPDPG